MAGKAFGVVCAVVCLILACGPGGRDAATGKKPGLAFAGDYHVEGTTIEKATGSERAIHGHVIITEQDGAYTWTFDMKTKFPTPDGPADTDVIGKGEGKLAGSVLRGRAWTQLVIGGVPGVDPAFAFIPRVTTTRIVSSAVAEFDDDGVLVVEIESEPEEGEEYTSTTTSLRGTRVVDKPPAGSRPSAPQAGAEGD
jgi:hypothetical protein